MKTTRHSFVMMYTFRFMFHQLYHKRSKQRNAMYIGRDGKQLQVSGPSVSKRLHTTPGTPNLRSMSVPHREEAPGVSADRGQNNKPGVTGRS